MSDLPAGWADTTLGDIVTLRSDKILPENVPDAPFIGLEDIEPHTSQILQVGRGSDVKSAVARFQRGDVLYSRLRPYLNKVTVAPFGGLASAEILVFQATAATSAEFVRRRIMTTEFLEFAASLDRGDRPRVNYAEISRFPIRLPPVPEQQRIMAKVDGLTSRVIRARAELDRVPVLITRYKQRLLALAFSGQLTAEWRELNSHVGRIIGRNSSEIRSKFANEVEGVFRPPYELPEHWDWLRLPELGDLDRGKSRHRPRNDPKLFGGEYPFIQTGDVRSAQRVLTEYTTTYSEFGLSQSKLWPVGTVCITIAANIAETAILGIEACFPDSVVGFLPDADRVSGEYIEYFIRTVRSDLEAFAPATAQKNINLNVLSAVRVPTPPLEEQAEIVRRINLAFGWLDSVAANQADAAQLLPKLDSSILTKAFRGELVPQDPSDVPASLALADGSAGESGAPKRGRGRPAKTRGPLASLTEAPIPDAAPATTPVAMPVAPKDSAMSKSRQDPDVMGQPYLAKILRKQPGAGSVDALFKAADLPVADFYKQLAWEIEKQHIREKQDRLEAA